MYVSDSAACSLPNSATPMPQSAIDAQNAYMAARGQAFTKGNDALNGLLVALGGNPIGSPQGNAGVPTSGGAFNPFAVTPFPLPAANPVTSGGAGAGSGAGGGSVSCVPELIELVTVVPVPTVVTPTRTYIPAPTPAPGPAPVPQVVPTQKPTPAAAAAPCVDPPECAPTPENICRLITEGCVSTNQVSKAQVLACAWSGWTGLMTKKGMCSINGWNHGEYLGSMNLKPVNRAGLYYDPPAVYQAAIDAGVNTPNGSPAPGVSGIVGDALTGPGASWVWGSIGLAAAAFYLAAQLDKKPSRRGRRY